MNARQIGCFYVSEELIYSDPDLMRAAMAMLGVVVLWVERKAFSRDLKYTALCEKFAEVPAGNVIPEYRVVVHTSPGKLRKSGGGVDVTHVQVVRVEKREESDGDLAQELIKWDREQR